MPGPITSPTKLFQIYKTPVPLSLQNSYPVGKMCSKYSAATIAPSQERVVRLIVVTKKEPPVEQNISNNLITFDNICNINYASNVSNIWHLHSIFYILKRSSKSRQNLIQGEEKI